MQIFNAKTQQPEDVVWTTDRNSELVCTFADGHFYKLPAGTTREGIEAWAVAHQQANQGQEVITPEMEAAQTAQRAASEALINELNGTPNVNPTAPAPTPSGTQTV